MSNRRHYYSWVCNDEGQPIAGVNITITLAGTSTATYIHTQSTGGTASNTTPQVITDANGYFEFWIADYTETHGYASGQKFKIAWELTGTITSDSIDYVDIFPSPFAVDETDTDTTKNKMVSNSLAKGWEDKTDTINFSVLTASWTSSGGDYYTQLEHGLGNNYPLVIVYDDTSLNSVPITAGFMDEDNTRVWKDNNNDAHVTFIG